MLNNKTFSENAQLPPEVVDYYYKYLFKKSCAEMKEFRFIIEWINIGGSKGCPRDVGPCLGSISFIFMQFSAKILSNNMFSAQTQGSAPTTHWKSWIRH